MDPTKPSPTPVPAPGGTEDDVYEIPAMPAAEAEIPAQWRSAATYTLESPARCPHCREPIRSVRVIGLVRAQVSFTSTLPRKGRVIVCPECERILSAELTGLV
jgi:DNA-directed RNA polymerase subunit RPC12/RpoP